MSSENISKSNEEVSEQDKIIADDQNAEPQEENGGKKNALIVEMEDEIQELRDKYLRLFAEFDNFKKRSLKEKIGLSKTAGQEVITGLLPVLDDFDRAKKNAEDATNEEVFSEGVELVYHKLYQALQQQGLRVMDITDTEFNPELHDAIANVEVQDESLKGKIIDYIEKGYLLNDKIIRHAKVVVGKR